MEKLSTKEQLEQLKKVAKFKKGTPEGIAAQKVLADIEMSEQGGEAGENGAAGQAEAPPAGGPNAQ
jgi:hypothetical protein